jgi:phosphoribosyl-ATP pyrophosphohydrolase/phosphoribosyl-AMP cyclohydrolase
MRWSAKKAKAFAGTIDFAKMQGLVPAIAQDEGTKDVLMLAFMNREALVKTLTNGLMHYYSRGRKRLWKKGEESGNVQQVVSAKQDCDSDSLLFSVRQKGPACHTGTGTCFGRKGFGVAALGDLIEGRTSSAKGSYTAKLLRNRKLACEKVMEEADELVEAAQKKGKRAVAWEAADLLYHLLVLASSRGVPFSRIEKELKQRHEKAPLRRVLGGW